MDLGFGFLVRNLYLVDLFKFETNVLFLGAFLFLMFLFNQPLFFFGVFVFFLETFLFLLGRIVSGVFLGDILEFLEFFLL